MTKRGRFDCDGIFVLRNIDIHCITLFRFKPTCFFSLVRREFYKFVLVHRKVKVFENTD